MQAPLNIISFCAFIMPTDREQLDDDQKYVYEKPITRMKYFLVHLFKDIWFF